MAGDNVGVDERQGRPTPDRPEDRPPPSPDADRPRPRVEIRPIVTPRPAPGPADVLLTPRDGPTHRPPDLIPPRGEDLAKMESPGDSLGERFRRFVFDEQTLENADDAIHTWVDNIESHFPDELKRPPTSHAEMRAATRGPTIHQPVQYGPDHADTIATVLATGILLGERLMWAYRKGLS